LPVLKITKFEVNI